MDTRLKCLASLTATLNKLTGIKEAKPKHQQFQDYYVLYKKNGNNIILIQMNIFGIWWVLSVGRGDITQKRLLTTGLGCNITDSTQIFPSQVQNAFFSLLFRTFKGQKTQRYRILNKIKPRNAANTHMSANGWQVWMTNRECDWD